MRTSASCHEPSFLCLNSAKKKNTKKPIRFGVANPSLLLLLIQHSQGALRNDGKLCRWVYLATCSHHHHLREAGSQGWEMTSGQTISIFSQLFLLIQFYSQDLHDFVLWKHTSPARSAFLVYCLIGMPSFAAKLLLSILGFASWLASRSACPVTDGNELLFPDAGWSPPGGKKRFPHSESTFFFKSFQHWSLSKVQ